MNLSTIRPSLLCTYFFLCACLLQNQCLSQCTTVGPLSGSSFSNDISVGNIAFITPSNASASDDSRATAAATLTFLVDNSNYLVATGFGFSIPSFASICGIVVEVEKSATNISVLAWINDNSVRLIKGGSIVGSNYATGTLWTDTDGYETYGGPSDLWGTAWTPADINASNFGVAFSAAISGIVGLLPRARIDHIRITVNYFVSALQLSITNFSAHGNSAHEADLEWTTINNDENVNFNIQRSDNGIEWNTIHTMTGEITSLDKTYHYTDKTCPGSTALYRLQTQHHSGNISYSHAIKVKWQAAPFRIYPNPAADYLIVEQEKEIKMLSCVATDGRNWPLHFTQTDKEHYKVGIGRLPRGTYLIRVNEVQKLFIKN